MTAGDLITTDWSYEFNGLLFGAGTAIGVEKLEGLDLPELRTSDVPRPADHGYFEGNDYLGRRTVTFSLDISGATDTAVTSTLDAIATATVPLNTGLPLVFQHPTRGKLQLTCKPRRRAIPIPQSSSIARRYKAVVEFVAVDPRIYSNTASTGSTGHTEATSGFGFDLSWNLSFGGAGSTSGVLSATNAGNFPTRPTAVITGPCVNPRVESLTTSQWLDFTIELATGDYLNLDFDARTVMLNGTASRYSSLTTDSSWFELQPGNNSIRFTVESTTGSPTLAMTWRSAYLL